MQPARSSHKFSHKFATGKRLLVWPLVLISGLAAIAGLAQAPPPLAPDDVVLENSVVRVGISNHLGGAIDYLVSILKLKLPCGETFTG